MVSLCPQCHLSFTQATSLYKVIFNQKFVPGCTCYFLSVIPWTLFFDNSKWGVKSAVALCIPCRVSWTVMEGLGSAFHHISGALRTFYLHKGWDVLLLALEWTERFSNDVECLLYHCRFTPILQLQREVLLLKWRSQNRLKRKPLSRLSEYRWSTLFWITLRKLCLSSLAQQFRIWFIFRTLSKQAAVLLSYPGYCRNIAFKWATTTSTFLEIHQL
jgi:hypothetical protein